MKVFPLYDYLALFIGSFLLSVALTPVARKFALSLGKIAVPQDDRWHKKETALLGGISIYVSYITLWFVAMFLMDWPTSGLSHFPIVLCASGIFAIGLADDFFNMMPQHKLAAQIVITSILIIFGFRLDWTFSKTANLVLSIVWIVGITNAFNLLDNMDGLSAGIATIASVFLFLKSYLTPTLTPLTGPILLMSAIYVGAVLGFLIYNFNPASIFMGDAGSLFIGFILACMTVMGSAGGSVGGSTSHLISVIAIPILILLIPILDTGFVSLMRKLFSRPISQGGRDHSSHRMVAIGFSERRAVFVLYILSIISGTIALAISYLTIGTSLVVIIVYLLFVLFFWIYLGKVKVYPEDSILSRDDRQGITPILIEITYRRRLFEVLLDVALITIAYYTAYLLRFEGVLGEDFDFFLKSLPLMIACQILWMYIMGVYRGVWERASLRDLNGYIKAITGGTVMPMLILLFIYRFESFSRAVFVIYWVLMIILISLSRLSFRILDESIRKGSQKGKPTLVYGAGVGGQMAMQEIETNRDLGMVLVGFIDDNTRIHGRKIQGYQVFGGQECLEKIIKEHHIEEIIVSFKKNGKEKKREVNNLCRSMDMNVAVTQMRLVIS